MSHEVMLILSAIGGIAALLLFVIVFRMHAFIALLLTSMLVGIVTGMPVTEILDSIKTGMGGTLGFVAVVVGLGAMFGRMLEVSGGVEQLAQTLLAKFGEERAQWALSFAGFIIAIPVFFDVGFIILVPIIYGLAKKTGRSLLYYGIPLLAGLAVTHSFIPPTPGPIAVAELVNADLGWVILFGAIAGLPAAILAGPVFGKIIANKIHATMPDYFHSEKQENPNAKLPSFRMILVMILLPLILILGNTISGVLLEDGNAFKTLLTFIGHPFVALLVATLLAFAILGRHCGYSKEDLQSLGTKALEPAGIIILITGAGGVFKQVLIDSGVGGVLAGMMASSAMPPVVLAFVIAALVRVAQGSATVAMITAAGILAPILETSNVTGPLLGLVVISIAAGATILSHVNDSGFWLVNRYFGLTEKETLRSWTVMETIIALVGFVVALVLSFFF